MADYDLQYQDTHIDALLATANELKTAGYIYKGVATPSTNPGTPTERVAYLASEPGTYTNFGGIVIASGLYSLTYAGGTWTGTQMQAGSDIEVVQTTGQSASAVMSQKAVTELPFIANGLKVNEKGFYLIDNDLNVAMQYNEDGFDVGKVSSHFVDVLKSSGVTYISVVAENGFFIVDEKLNIGVKVDSNGIHAKNILEYVIVED